jgi:hypothetical protein
MRRDPEYRLRNVPEHARTNAYQLGHTRERRRCRGVLLSHALKSYGHDYVIVEIDSNGEIR